MRRDARWLRQLGTMERVRELTDSKEYAEARDLLLQMRADSRGKHSGHVSWCLSIVSDYLEDFEMALTYVEEATAADPLAVPYHRSFDIIVEHLRSALTADARAVDDPSMPRLYKLLVASGEANLGSHLAMARFQAAQHDFVSALKLLDAVTTLEPTSREAWVALAEVARAAGNKELAERADFETAALADDRVVPFSIPGQAQG